MDGGFQFCDDELGPKVPKSVKTKQNELLKEIDNLAFLKEYGIFLPEKD
jgi:hypothetical protein